MMYSIDWGCRTLHGTWSVLVLIMICCLDNKSESINNGPYTKCFFKVSSTWWCSIKGEPFRLGPVEHCTALETCCAVEMLSVTDDSFLLIYLLELKSPLLLICFQCSHVFLVINAVIYECMTASTLQNEEIHAPCLSVLFSMVLMLFASMNGWVLGTHACCPPQTDKKSK